MKDTFTFSTTKERLVKIDGFVNENNNQFKDYSSVINASIDKFFDLIEINLTVDFMHSVGVGLFLFLICIGLVLFSPNIYFFILCGFSGVYLIVFIFLFYNKYVGVKWQKR